MDPMFFIEAVAAGALLVGGILGYLIGEIVRRIIDEI